jgi:hypothetical protein
MFRRRAHNCKISFLCVYIREAHASDVWPIDGLKVREPQTTEERVQVAATFKTSSGFEWPVAVDCIEDSFLKAYSPWPFRFYVFEDDILALKSSPVEGTHSTDQVEDLLRSFEASSQ